MSPPRSANHAASTIRMSAITEEPAPRGTVIGAAEEVVAPACARPAGATIDCARPANRAGQALDGLIVADLGVLPALFLSAGVLVKHQLQRRR